ncbi:MAG TPA: DNA repair protein RecN [Bacilli bacterium]
MLMELAIRNLAVIEKIQVDFNKGFHVLTGETGAGKSILIDALSLIAGGRGSADLVRYGCDKADVEALFDVDLHHPVWDVLDKVGIDFEKEEHLVIRREITSQGKSSARINGQIVNLSMLREAGDCLINIHGQHEHQSLLKVDRHIQLLDLFGYKDIMQVKLAYQASFEKYNELAKQLKFLQENTQQTLQMTDLYRFQTEEIETASLKVNEDELIQDERRKLSNAEKLFDAISQSHDVIYGGTKVLDLLGKATTKLKDAVTYDQQVLQPLYDQIQTAYYQLEDAAYQLRDYKEQIEFNPSRLEQIEQRLDLIASLRRKYGNNVQEILDYLHKIKHELDLVENKDAILRELQGKADQELSALTGHAAKLTELRRLTAVKLASRIEIELADLHMEKTRFEVHFEPLDEGELKFSKDGWDQVEFLISANPGEPLRSLVKIASGGELSRVMLALKSIFSTMDRIPVLVFDEVDTGVSGRAAQAIAEKISRLSDSCQVFSITHLPQVACMANAHYVITKQTEGERTFTSILLLDRKGRTDELARMLGGVEITETTL